MKVKLDENLGNPAAELFRAAGHDVATVGQQRMGSASDRDVIAACRREARCLVSLDLGFANPLLFKPSEQAGIAVLRLPSRPTAEDLVAAVSKLVAKLAVAGIAGKLWVVERDRIREYQPDGPDVEER